MEDFSMTRIHRLAGISLMLILVSLTFSLSAQAPRDERRAAAESGNSVRVGGGDAPLPYIRDGGIEQSITDGSHLVSTAWDSTQTVFETPLCGTVCGTDITFGPRTGSNWVLFLGSSSVLRTGSMSQVVIFPKTGYLQLHFYQRVGLADGVATLTVTVDGNVVDTQTTGATSDTYSGRGVNLTAYADGKPHTISIDFVQTALGNIRWNLDDIRLLPGSTFPLINVGFEDEPFFGWTQVNKTGDKLKCNRVDKTFSYTGACAMRFKGSPGENSIIKQRGPLIIREALPLPEVNQRAPANQAIIIGAMFKANALTKGKLIVKIFFTDSPTLKFKKGVKPTSGWQWIQTAPTPFPISLNFTEIEWTYVNKSQPGGKVYIDNATAIRQTF
jgi:hypothetical protein